jgi:hypothetical protein
MKPRARRQTGQNNLFKARLDQIIDLGHELVLLGSAIDWAFLEGAADFGLHLALRGLNILGMPGNDLLSHSVVPSALERFTVEFGMGSSGGVPLKSPGKRRMFWIKSTGYHKQPVDLTQNDLDFFSSTHLDGEH